VLRIDLIFADDDSRPQYEYIYSAPALLHHFEPSYIHYRTGPYFKEDMLATLDLFIPSLIQLTQSEEHEKLDQELIILAHLIVQLSEIDEAKYMNGDWDLWEELLLNDTANYKQNNDRLSSMQDGTDDVDSRLMEAIIPIPFLPSEWAAFVDSEDQVISTLSSDALPTSTENENHH